MKRILMWTIVSMLLCFQSSRLAAGDKAWQADKDTIALWAFEEGTGEYTYNKANGEQRGKLTVGTKWVKETNDSGIAFDGISGKILIEGGKTVTIAPEDTFTLDVSFKVNPAKELSTMQIYSHQAFGLELRGREGGNVRLNLLDVSSKTPFWFAGKINVCDGAWHRILVVKDPEQKLFFLFVDGNQDGMANCPPQMNFTIPAEGAIGGEQGDPDARKGEYFSGVISGLFITKKKFQ
ncbi:MAG: LamG-like jellyroll fold domain-containing protein [Candidatus Omnitrophota bacterium]